MHILMSFFEENEWLIYILIKALKMTWKKIQWTKNLCIHYTCKICHRSYVQVEEPILCTVQLCILYTTDGTANALESSTEATGGTEALTDCDKMVVVLELLTQLSITQLASLTRTSDEIAELLEVDELSPPIAAE